MTIALASPSLSAFERSKICRRLSLPGYGRRRASQEGAEDQLRESCHHRRNRQDELSTSRRGGGREGGGQRRISLEWSADEEDGNGSDDDENFEIGDYPSCPIQVVAKPQQDDQTPAKGVKGDEEALDSSGSQRTADTSTAESTLGDSVGTHDSRISADVTVTSPTTSGRNTSPPPREVVRFGSVEIREYPRLLGDNPSVTSGPPLTLDWCYRVAASVEMDLYESTKPQPREKHQMLVPRFVREEWLVDAGYSRGEIADAAKRVQEDKAMRAKSANQRGVERKALAIRESLMRFQRKTSPVTAVRTYRRAGRRSSDPTS